MPLNSVGILLPISVGKGSGSYCFFSLLSRRKMVLKQSFLLIRTLTGP